METFERVEEIHFDEKEPQSVKGEYVMTKEEKEKSTFYIRCTFLIFIFIWIFVIASNRLYESNALFVLLIPFGLFGLGFLNSSDISDDNVEEDVFSATFITTGLVLSIPLLGIFNREKMDSFLTHIIFLAMVFTLFSYFHIWVDRTDRHICKIIRSCFETIAVTLYTFAIIIFFLMP